MTGHRYYSAGWDGSVLSCPSEEQFDVYIQIDIYTCMASSDPQCKVNQGGKAEGDLLLLPLGAKIRWRRRRRRPWLGYS